MQITNLLVKASYWFRSDHLSDPDYSNRLQSSVTVERVAGRGDHSHSRGHGRSAGGGGLQLSSALKLISQVLASDVVDCFPAVNCSVWCRW